MKCRFCGKQAGFFKKEHIECRNAYENGKKYIKECIEYIYAERDCMNIREVVKNSTTQYNISVEEVKKIIFEAWNNMVIEALSDDIIEFDEVAILRGMIEQLDISKEELSKSEAWRNLLYKGEKEITDVIKHMVKNMNFDNVNEKLKSICFNYGFSNDVLKKMILINLDKLLDDIFEDGIISVEEEEFIEKFIEFFGFEQDEIVSQSEKIIKGLILRDVLSGTVPSRVSIDDIPIILQKNESIIWAYPCVACYQDKKRKYYQGGSSGVSVKVMQGVYLRSGAIKGHPVEYTENVYLGDGGLFITNKHLFWISADKSIKIPVKKIISVLPVDDGIVIQKDGATALPLTFLVNDSWFLCNLLSNINLL